MEQRIYPFKAIRLHLLYALEVATLLPIRRPALKRKYGMTECCHCPCPHEATLCYGLWMVVFLTRKFNPCIVKHLLICFLTSFFSESSPRPPRHPLHVKHMTILLYYLLFCFHHVSLSHLNTFAASYLNTQGLNNSCLKSPASTLVDLTFQSCALRSFSLNQLHNLSLQAGNLHNSFSISS